MMDCAISSMQIDMRIYTAAETKTPYFKQDYSLCDFVVQAQGPKGISLWGFTYHRNSWQASEKLYLRQVRIIAKITRQN